jgi:16S rRNA G966 N2-methylase RsmD
VRVIAGKYRSRRLHTVRGLALRPSSDRLRQTLFDILAAQVDAAVFLDLFAGSGAVGIEALSRGARHAIFVENHPAGAAALRRNLASLDIAVHEHVLPGARSPHNSSVRAPSSRTTPIGAIPMGTTPMGTTSFPQTSIAAASARSASFANIEFAGTAEILVHNAVAAIEGLDASGARVDLVFVDPPYADSEAYDSVLDLLGDSDLVTHSGIVIFEHHQKRQLPACVGQLERTRIVKQGDTALSFYRVVLAA